MSKNCPDNPEAKVKNKDADVAPSGENIGDCTGTSLASAAPQAEGSVPRGQKDESKARHPTDVIGASVRGELEIERGLLETRFVPRLCAIFSLTLSYTDGVRCWEYVRGKGVKMYRRNSAYERRLLGWW